VPVFVSTTYAPLDSSVFVAIEELNRAGIERIELGSTHCWEEHSVSRLTNNTSEFLVHNYFPPRKESIVVNIASIDDDIRQRSIEHALDCIQAAADIGAKLYTFHPGFLSDPQSPSRSPANYDFVFRAQTVPASVYERCFSRFLEATRILVDRAGRLGVRLAVESEGSMSKRRLLLLQRPEELDRLLSAFSREELGVNLNIGHLNLSSRAFSFDPLELMDRFASRFVAMEVSHNDGEHDDHRVPRPQTWYWAAVSDRRFRDIPIIIECRDTNIDDISDTCRRLTQALMGSDKSDGR
jgi:sugar phosphate isomerase/epimerase